MKKRTFAAAVLALAAAAAHAQAPDNALRIVTGFVPGGATDRVARIAFREAGLPLVATGWNAFFAPATMPAATVQRYAPAITEVMKDADTQRKFLAAQMSPVVATQAQTAAMLKAYRAQWAPVVQKSGYQP